MISTLQNPRSPEDASSDVAVSCRDIVKDFGDGDSRLRVLRGVNLEIHEGELTLLVGPSGCGKTTLISIIAGVMEATSGDVELFGSSQSHLKSCERIEFRARNIGFVFQQFNLLPALTAVENACVPLLINNVPRRQALVRAKDLIGAVGLEDRGHHTPSHLSGGQQQRVAIARALVHEPKLLICDEPTAALDAHSGKIIMEMIRAVAVQKGRAVIVVTHDSRVFEYGDRIATMADGQIESVERIAR